MFRSEKQSKSGPKQEISVLKGHIYIIALLTEVVNQNHLAENSLEE